ncbi:MAG: hypothetical protein PHC90_03415 [Syntrophorhabdaceae bacterium]|nr:hypothetical protein [Syntrophorhabdaceae bacterium]
MIIEKAMIFFGWCTVINLMVLLLWFLAFSRAHEILYRVHGQWFKISRETFDAIHYTGMAFYKVCIILFNLVPMIALRIAS